MVTLDRGHFLCKILSPMAPIKWPFGLQENPPLSAVHVMSWELRAICTSRFVVNADGGVCMVTLDRGRSSGGDPFRWSP